MRALIVATSLLVVVPALAEPTAAQIAEARKEFGRGLEREEAGDWSGALAIFQRVALVKANHIVRFHIALCLEKTGRLVDAMAEFAIAKTTAEREGGTDADLTIANASKHVAALRARIPSVRVDAPKEATVLIDGTPSPLVGTPIVLDPGEHVIEVRAERKKPFTRKVTLVDGVTAPVVVAAKLEDEPVTVTVTPQPKPEPKPVAPDRTAAWIATGVAGAAFVGAGVFAALRSSTLSDLDAACDASRANCDPSRRDLESRGKTYTIATDTLLGVGAIAAGTAIILFTAGGESASVRAAVGPGSLRIVAIF